MYILDDIAYAGQVSPALSVCEVRPLDDYKLWVHFSDGETKIFDFKPLLSASAFTPLSNLETFKSVYLDYGVPTWNDGDIDISPEYLYKHSICAESAVNA